MAGMRIESKITSFGWLWKRFLAASLLLLTLQLLQPQALAYSGFDGRDEGSANERPKALTDVGIEEKLGEPIDLDLQFHDEKGQTVRLGDFVHGNQPLLLSLVYFGCPGLCNFHLNGLTEAFRKMPAPLGKEFQYVAVSIEPKETSETAAKKRDAYILSYGRPEGAAGWHFLTGSEENIRKLAKDVGFRYSWDKDSNQWAHGSVAMVVTPDGRLSRYFYGITFNPSDLRLSLVEASNGNIGTVVDKLVLFCFHYDPKVSKYTVAAFNVMRAGVALAVLVMAGFLIPFWWRNRKELRGDV
jgi:protein SCO1/2